MASHSVHCVLLASGTSCGAARVEALLDGGAGGSILAAAIGGVGPNLLHQFVGWCREALALTEPAQFHMLCIYFIMYE